MWPPFYLTTSCKRTLAFVTTFRHKSSESARHNFTMWSLSCATFSGLFWPQKEARKGCEAKWWSYWTCSSLGTIFQPMRINSVPDVKCFCNNKNVLCAQSMVWHFVRHPVAYMCELTTASVSRNVDFCNKWPIFTETYMTTVAVEVTVRYIFWPFLSSKGGQKRRVCVCVSVQQDTL